MCTYLQWERFGEHRTFVKFHVCTYVEVRRYQRQDLCRCTYAQFATTMSESCARLVAYLCEGAHVKRCAYAQIHTCTHVQLQSFALAFGMSGLGASALVHSRLAYESKHMRVCAYAHLQDHSPIHPDKTRNS